MLAQGDAEPGSRAARKAGGERIYWVPEAGTRQAGIMDPAPQDPDRPAPGPGRLAILGAGPVGLEAALAAAEAGWPFTLYEAGDEPAAHVREWGHVRLFSPWSMDVSGRMRRRLRSSGLRVPGGDGCPTGAELRARVLEPIARCAAVAPHLRLGHRVRAVGRTGLRKQEEIGSERRAARPFRLLVTTPDGGERIDAADTVLDCTGTWGQPNTLGDGGIPAPGERAADGAVRRHLPDFAAEAGAWAGRRILLVGGGHSAQTAARDLADLAAVAPGTRVAWLQPAAGVAPPDREDPLPARRALAERAAALGRGASPAFEVLAGAVVERLGPGGDGRIAVRLTTRSAESRELEVDRILSLTGYVGDLSLHRQLQVNLCYATEGPMQLAAALLAADGGGDCLAPVDLGADVLVHPEPRFFVLGTKSYGRASAFLMRHGWRQVDDVVALLGGPAEAA